MTKNMNETGWDMLARWGTYNMANNPMFGVLREEALKRCCAHVLADHKDGSPGLKTPHLMMQDILKVLGETHGIDCSASAAAALRACADMMILREISDQPILEDLKEAMIDLPTSLDQ